MTLTAGDYPGVLIGGEVASKQSLLHFPCDRSINAAEMQMRPGQIDLILRGEGGRIGRSGGLALQLMDGTMKKKVLEKGPADVFI